MALVSRKNKSIPVPTRIEGYAKWDNLRKLLGFIDDAGETEFNKLVVGILDAAALLVYLNALP